MIGALIGAGASLLGGLFGSSSAEKAAEAQASASRDATKLQRYMYDTSRADTMPWLDAGKTALGTYMSELGLGSGATGPSNAFKETPGYQFRVAEGEKGVLNSLSAMGMKNSGKALKSLERFRQGIASDEYGSWLDRIAGVAGQGQNQANSNTQTSANAANSMAGTIQNAGEARASGYVGANNAMMQGINGAANSIGQFFGGGNSFGTSNGFRNMIYGQ